MRYGLEHLDLFIANRFAVGAHRRLHRQIGQNLEQMILNHIANRVRGIVECAATLNPEVLAMVICTFSTCVRFQNGSRSEFTKRKKSMLFTGRLPR